MKKTILIIAASVCLVFGQLTLLAQEKGDLIYIETEHVNPQHVADYLAWAKAYKALADETGGHDFYVSSGIGSFSYIHNIGPEYAGIETLMTERDAWMKANPKAGELYDQYGNTVDHVTRSLWRHSPKYSYDTEGSPESNNTYTRLFTGYIRQGQNKAVGELLAEYKQLWKENDLGVPYGIYFNVFGEEQTCMLVVQDFKDRAAWAAFDKVVNDKIGKEKLAELDKKWNQVLRKMEASEATPHVELSHINN